jgi:transposase
MSGCAIGRQTETSASKVWKILKGINPKVLKEEGRRYMEDAEEIYIGIDEHSFSGRDMVIIITDIKARKVLDFIEDMTQKNVSEWFKELPEHILKKIK